jgi:hypothetical protein
MHNTQTMIQSIKIFNTCNCKHKTFVPSITFEKKRFFSILNPYIIGSTKNWARAMQTHLPSTWAARRALLDQRQTPTKKGPILQQTPKWQPPRWQPPKQTRVEMQPSRQVQQVQSRPHLCRFIH